MTYERLISSAADEVGVVPETLREYERLGLIKPKRNSVGQRVYSAEDIALAQRILTRRLKSRISGLLKGR